MKSLSIDFHKHIQICKKLGENRDVSVYVLKNMAIIRCGAIEIQSLHASSIALKLYKFKITSIH
ncbi:unnamed protein product [Brassicogethes aeneus]|uniref:Uncharacterized protein n=1 Tax=Brassicogethes aeneus TaxID=1431903 RepID=A0A9P0FB58_BRAAE|nr:unnamed protein product [Brassicogethes aeneus]